jgi:hypothetical protein
MGNPYYPAELTPASIDDFLTAAGYAWKGVFNREATPNALYVMCGHWMIETGRGELMYCYNCGNIKAPLDDPDKYEGGITYYQGGENLDVLVWADFSPVYHYKQLVNRFRAYSNFQEGINDYLTFKKTRCANALPYAYSGDPANYSKALKAVNYYTGPENEYTPGLVGCFYDARKHKIPTPTATPLREIAPAKCDPVQSPNPPPAGIRPYPPRGPKPTHGTCSCGKCNGIYAYHLGWREGKTPVAPPISEGAPCEPPPKLQSSPPSNPASTSALTNTTSAAGQSATPSAAGQSASLPANATLLGEGDVPAVLVSAKDAPIDIVIEKHGMLTFTALDADNKALEGWSWQAAGPGATKQGLIDSSGKVSVPLPQGTYQVTITRQPLASSTGPAAPVSSKEVGDGEASKRRTQPIETILDHLRSSQVVPKNP